MENFSNRSEIEKQASLSLFTIWKNNSLTWKQTQALSEDSISFPVYYSFQYKAGDMGGWGGSASKILTLEISCQPTGPRKLVSGEALASPCPSWGAVFWETVTVPKQIQHCFYLHPFLNWGSVDRRMQLVKQKCWLSLGSGCQGNSDRTDGLGGRLRNFFGRSHRFLLGLKATTGSGWPAGWPLTAIPDQGPWGGTHPAVAALVCGEGSEVCFLSREE